MVPQTSRPVLDLECLPGRLGFECSDNPQFPFPHVIVDDHRLGSIESLGGGPV